MHPSYRKLIIMLLILLLIAGCATSGTTAGSNSSNTDTTQTKVEGTAIGAGVGALLGAGIAIATGHKDDAWKYAAGGAAAGGLMGYIAGHRVAQIKEQYATEEEELNAEINLAKVMNQEINDSNTATLNQIKSLEQEKAQLASTNCSREKQAANLEKQKTKTINLIQANNETINTKKTEIVALIDYKTSVEQTQNDQQVKKLELEITTLQTNIAMLDQSNQQMAQTVESLNARK